MAKNIVVCCDGTGNTFGSATTVVRKLYDMVDKSAQDVYYDPGLGTAPADAFGSTVGRGLTSPFGKAFAFGITRNILEAYEFLMDNYEPKSEPKTGSKVFFFGFSRGAFTVRRLAKMVANCGLPPKGGKNLIPYAYDAYRRFKDDNDDPVYKSFSDLSVKCDPWFIGVWDTVKSIGLRLEPPLTCNLASEIHHARHALALDERRRGFQPNLWDPDSKQEVRNRIKQRWFSGDHSDIGGGHDVAEQDDLSMIALRWMVGEATKNGLLVNDRKMEHVNELALSMRPESRTIHDLYRTKLWPILGQSQRRVPLDKTHELDDSVLAKCDALEPAKRKKYMKKKGIDRFFSEA